KPQAFWVAATPDFARAHPGCAAATTRQLFRGRDALDAPLRQQRAQGRRLERLMEHLDVVGARLLPHARAAVGGDQDGGEIGAETPTQRTDSSDAVAIVE